MTLTQILQKIKSAFYTKSEADNRYLPLGGGNVSSLTVGGKNVDTIDSQGDGWIRYTNGIQICWVDHDLNHGAWILAPFPKPFLYAPIVVATACDARIEATTYVHVRSIDNANVIFSCPYGDCWHALYMAIGRWK